MCQTRRAILRGQLDCGSLVFEFLLQSPRQKCLQVGLRLGIGHTLNDFFEIPIGINLVGDASLNEAIKDCACFHAIDTVSTYPSLPTHNNAFYVPLGNVVVD